MGKDISAFVEEEVERLYRVFSDKEDWFKEEEDIRANSREAFLKIMLNFLRDRKQEDLADTLQSSKNI